MCLCAIDALSKLNYVHVNGSLFQGSEKLFVKLSTRFFKSGSLKLISQFLFGG